MTSDFGYVRIAAAVPPVQPGAVAANVQGMLDAAQDLQQMQPDIVLFPELCVTAYTCADLFQQTALLDAAEAGLGTFAAATADNPAVLVVGVPLRQDGVLFNCAAVLQGGHVLGVVPKTFIPGYREYYETRWFAPAQAARSDHIRVCGGLVPFGTNLLFSDPQRSAFCMGVEICEDLWAPSPPSTALALAGATVIVNPSASNALVGKADYRRSLVQQQSARCLAAYAYCSAGVGESSTDMVFGGHALVAENGVLLAETDRFERARTTLTMDVDLDFVQHERINNAVFSQAVQQHAESGRQCCGSACACHRIPVHTRGQLPPRPLQRRVDRHPFIPGDPSRRRERCQEIFAIQSSGLATRLQHTGIRDVVIGLSGGLDSTLALLVVRDAYSRLGLAPSGVHCLTMPGFGTSERTLGNVHALCEGLGVALTTVDITPSCRQHMADIGHDGETGDIAFENVQARERTQILMDKANMLGGLVVGTGDLSELALGWCTYNGDHMSMYAVNSGVPKTLVRYLIEYVASSRSTPAVAQVLTDILDTPISPELLPPDRHGQISQQTEAVVGPYELHDFFLYHCIRCGFAPDKVLFLAEQAFGTAYPAAELRQWLQVFCKRFFQQQFKRSCLPDGPKVGTIALSPRGDWRMPSDASATVWLELLEE